MSAKCVSYDALGSKAALPFTGYAWPIPFRLWLKTEDAILLLLYPYHLRKYSYNIFIKQLPRLSFSVDYISLQEYCQAVDPLDLYTRAF